MKIGVISDTHDHLIQIGRAVDLLNARPLEMVVHAGDLISPFTANEFEKLRHPMVAIYGNNDGERFGLRQKFTSIDIPIHEAPYDLELNKRKILLIHENDLIQPLADSGRYDVILYGHTHTPFVRQGKCLVVNPGETCGWVTGKSTLAIVDLDALTAEIIEMKPASISGNISSKPTA